ncbi:MAG: dihydrofolate reductase [Acidobacteriota bacterium]|nr:dihydrofolate reductase [Acidobacteriota bacterium]
MRRVRYSVAMSLDGYIAGRDGEAGWIPHDPSFDFNALFSQFDTVLIGRNTFESMVRAGQTVMPGMNTYVFSTTLRQENHPGVTLVSGDPTPLVRKLRAERGKDIWLFGGGQLFRSFLEAGLVDTVEIALVPVLLGGGIPVLAPLGQSTNLKLVAARPFENTGIVALEYQCERS